MNGQLLWTIACVFAFVMFVMCACWMFWTDQYPEVASDLFNFISQIILLVVGFFFGRKADSQ